MRFINRDWTRSEHDDFELNIATRLSNLSGAIPMNIDGIIVGWVIQVIYE